jgi:hypothetical protein
MGVLIDRLDHGLYRRLFHGAYLNMDELRLTLSVLC